MCAVTVNTVCGPVSSDELGITLVHEHLVSGFAGWYGDLTAAPFDHDLIFETCMATLEELKTHGVKTIIEATPNDTGRCPEMYRELSEASGIQVICSTGYFSEAAGASSYWRARSWLTDVVDEITGMFIKEISEGIGGTGIKPGVIKVATGENTITDYERRFFKAAAGAQQETGLPIITHTSGGTMGPDQAELLISEGADPRRIMIGHMSDTTDTENHLRVLDLGVYNAFDRMGLQGMLGSPLDEEKYPVLLDLLSAGHADRLLLSHDSCAFWLGRPFFEALPEAMRDLNATWHPTHLFRTVLPRLRQYGVSEHQIKTMIQENPRRLFEGS